MRVFRVIAVSWFISAVVLNLFLFLSHPNQLLIGLINLIGFGIMTLTFFILLFFLKRPGGMSLKDMWFFLSVPIVFPICTVIGLLLLIMA